MNSREIENNVMELVENFNQDEFIYDLLLAYGITKSTVTLLKKGSLNLSKEENTVFLKKKVFFKVIKDSLLDSIDSISKDEKVLNQKTRFRFQLFLIALGRFLWFDLFCLENRNPEGSWASPGWPGKLCGRLWRAPNSDH